MPHLFPFFSKILTQKSFVGGGSFGSFPLPHFFYPPFISIYLIFLFCIFLMCFLCFLCQIREIAVRGQPPIFSYHAPLLDVTQSPNFKSTQRRYRPKWRVARTSGRNFLDPSRSSHHGSPRSFLPTPRLTPLGSLDLRLHRSTSGFL